LTQPQKLHGEQRASHIATETFKIFGVALALGLAAFTMPRHFGGDSHAYWLTHSGVEYAASVMTPNAYLYSPAFAEALRPFALLPWPAFAFLWSLALAVGLAWLLRPLRWWAPWLWLAGLPEVVSGNVFILLAVAAVWGVQRGGPWAFPALTKITPCLGPVWFLARREWRQLGYAAASTAAIALVSATLSPHLWTDWISFLWSTMGRASAPLGASIWPPLVWRLPLAVVLVLWGARRGHTWVIPVGMVAASPVIWFGTFTLLAALPRMQRVSPAVGRGSTRGAARPDTRGVGMPIGRGELAAYPRLRLTIKWRACVPGSPQLDRTVGRPQRSFSRRAGRSTNA